MNNSSNSSMKTQGIAHTTYQEVYKLRSTQTAEDLQARVKFICSLSMDELANILVVTDKGRQTLIEVAQDQEVKKYLKEKVGVNGLYLIIGKAYILAAKSGQLVKMTLIEKSAICSHLTARIIKKSAMEAYCFAAMNGHLEVVQHVEKQVPSTNLKDSLHDLCATQSEVIKYLNSRKLHWIFTADHGLKANKMMQQIAAQNNDLAVIKHLEIRVTPGIGSVALIYSIAAANGYFVVIEHLATQMKPDELQQGRSHGYLTAAENGNLEAVQYLAALIEPAKLQEINDTAYYYAAGNGHVGVMKCLQTQTKAGISQKVIMRSYLWAAQNGYIEAMKYLAAQMHSATLQEAIIGSEVVVDGIKYLEAQVQPGTLEEALINSEVVATRYLTKDGCITNPQINLKDYVKLGEFQDEDGKVLATTRYYSKKNHHIIEFQKKRSLISAYNFAVQNGHVEVMKHLDETISSDELRQVRIYRIAVENDQLEAMKYLEQKVNSDELKEMVVYFYNIAVENGYLEVMKHLAARATPAQLEMMANNLYTLIVGRQVKVAQCLALQAAPKQYQELVRILYRVAVLYEQLDQGKALIEQMARRKMLNMVGTKSHSRWELAVENIGLKMWQHLKTLMATNKSEKLQEIQKSISDQQGIVYALAARNGDLQTMQELADQVEPAKLQEMISGNDYDVCRQAADHEHFCIIEHLEKEVAPGKLLEMSHRAHDNISVAKRFNSPWILGELYSKIRLLGHTLMMCDQKERDGRVLYSVTQLGTPSVQLKYMEMTKQYIDIVGLQCKKMGIDLWRLHKLEDSSLALRRLSLNLLCMQFDKANLPPEIIIHVLGFAVDVHGVSTKDMLVVLDACGYDKDTGCTHPPVIFVGQTLLRALNNEVVRVKAAQEAKDKNNG